MGDFLSDLNSEYNDFLFSTCAFFCKLKLNEKSEFILVILSKKKWTRMHFCTQVL